VLDLNLTSFSTIVTCHFEKLHSAILKSDVIFRKLNSLLLNFGNQSKLIITTFMTIKLRLHCFFFNDI
jgi:hypothetical protein